MTNGGGVGGLVRSTVNHLVGAGLVPAQPQGGYKTLPYIIYMEGEILRCAQG